MIIAVDIGNTNIVVGGIEADHVLFTERLSTRTDKTELEYAIDFKLIFELYFTRTGGRQHYLICRSTFIEYCKDSTDKINS